MFGCVHVFLHCSLNVKYCPFFLFSSEGKTSISFNNEKIRSLYNQIFSILACFSVLAMRRSVGQIVLPFLALYNATSVHTKICEAVGTGDLIFHNRISLMWCVPAVGMTCIQQTNTFPWILSSGLITPPLFSRRRAYRTHTEQTPSINCVSKCLNIMLLCSE